MSDHTNMNGGKPSWQNDDGSVSFDDLHDLHDMGDRFQESSYVGKPRKLDDEQQAVAAEFAGQHSSVSTARRFKCEGCKGTGYINVYKRGHGWDQIPELKTCWKGCGGSGFTKTDPATLKLRREKAAQKKVARADANREQARAFLDSRADVAAWFVSRRASERYNEFAESLWDALHKYGSLTANQLAAVERQIEGDRVREQERAAKAEQAKAEAAARGETALDLSSLHSGMYAVPNGETRLKVRINRPKANSRWHGFIFVDDGAVYGQRQNYGRQKPGGVYEGKIQDQLRAIMADPQAAMAAYGLLTGRCGHCGRALEDAVSVARGIGPVCAGKLGWE